MKPREYFINGYTVKQYSDGDVIIYKGNGMMSDKFWHIHLTRRITKRKAKELVRRWKWSEGIDMAVEAFR